MRDLYNIDDWNDVSFSRLGEILIESGKVNLLHLSMVLDIQRFQKMQMGQILLSMKVLNKKDLNQALIIQKVLQNRKHA